MHLRALVLLTMAFLASSVCASPQTRNVVLVTLDGVRVQEVGHDALG